MAETVGVGKLCPEFHGRIGLVCSVNRVPGDAASAYQPVKQWPRFSWAVGEHRPGKTSEERIGGGLVLRAEYSEGSVTD